MSEKIAIDIVLLLPQNIVDLAFGLNKNTDQRKMKFGTDFGDAIPHITLGMGVVSNLDLPKLEVELELIYKEFLPVNLSLKGTGGGEIKEEGYVWGINIEKNEQIISLHYKIIDILKKYLDKEFDDRVFFDKDHRTKMAFNYVTKFNEYSAHDRFSPHITIGFGEELKINNVNFQSSALAICQLGSYCTCKKILSKFSV